MGPNPTCAAQLSDRAPSFLAAKRWVARQPARGGELDQGVGEAPARPAVSEKNSEKRCLESPC